MRRVCYLLFLLIGIVRCDALWGQANPEAGGYCGSDLVRTLNSSPEMIARQQRIDRLLYQLLDGGNRSGRSAQGAGPNDIYTIPIVVHIVHNGGSENISDAQVLAGIQHMNDAFANVGVYDPSTGVDVGIQFCLAKQDPNGAFTTGITRTISSLTDLTLETQDGDLKNLVRWDPQSYLNIWLVREVSSMSGGSGVAGYAYFPSSHGRPEDGIVGEARWFGSSPASSSMYVHEAGHYLGLYHTFEGGCANNDCLADGDRVCDTPPDATTAPIACNTTFNSCTTDADDVSPNNPFRPVANGGLGEQNDLFSDYMDYGRWECYSVFTQGQKDRMRAALTEVRKSLLVSKGCLSPCPNPAIASFNASATSVTAGATVNFTNTSTRATSYEWLVDGVRFATSANASYTFNTQGRHTVVLKALTGDAGCDDIDSIVIVVTCPVRASFTAGSTSILPGESVTFTGTSTGASSYQWLIDGVSVGTGRDLTYLFNKAGGYRVVLVASNGICSDTSLGVYVRVGMCEPAKRWNVWYFGNGAGVDFNGGNPVAVTNSVMNESEGVTSICDRDGNILLYSNGITVWNRRRLPIPGGTGLLGHTSYGSSQGAMLVPAPNSETLYYLFTTSNWTDATTELRYSIIDMSLDGGYGGMTSVRDVVLNGNVAEQLVGVMHGNCRDIWIVSHERATNRYVSYLLTPSGLVTTPVVSAVGSNTAGSNRYGCLKVSRDAKLLSSAFGGNTSDATLEVFDFDDMTGQVSNPRALANGGSDLGSVMSSEFSPDGRYLYTSGFTSPTIYQYDLTAGDVAAIRASRKTVFNASGQMTWYQLGPDDRIYIAGGMASLAVIQYPNQPVPACGFVEMGLDLRGQFSQSNLPAPIARYGERSIKIDGPRSICLADSVQTFTVDSRGCNRTAHAWRVSGNAEILSQADRTATVRMKDSGAVTLIVEKVDGCGLVADTLLIDVTPGAPRVDLGPDTALCSGGAILLDAGPSGSYLWQDGSTGRTLSVNTPGTYWVERSVGAGCAARDTIEVFPDDDNLSVNLGPDTTMCDGKIMVLDAGAGGVRYRWQDGSADRTLTAYRPGTYWVEVVGHCGAALDTIVIQPGASAVTLGRDTAVCGTVNLLLDAGPGFISYLWQDSSSGRTFSARGPGIYWVEVVLPSGCISRDTIEIGRGGDGAALAASLAEGPSMEIAPGTEISIPLLLTSASGGPPEPGRAYTATIRFNGTLLLPIGSTPQGTMRGGERVLTLSGTVGASDTLALLRFLVLLGDSDRTFISIDSFSVDGDCVGDIARQEGVVSVSVCRTGSRRLLAGGEAASLAVRREHPASKRVAIEYVLIESGTTRLSLFDGRGRRVGIISEEAGLAGHHTASLDMGALDAGLYFILLETPTEVLVEKFLAGE